MGWKDRAKPQNSSWKDRANPVTPPSEEHGIGEKLASGAMGLGQGVTANWLDEMAGIAGMNQEMKMREMGVSDSDEDVADIYKRNRDNVRELDKKAQEISPELYGTGQVVGGIGSGIVTGGGLPAALAMGGAAGLGASESENPTEMAKDTLLGVGASGLGYGAGKVVGKVGQSVASKGGKGLKTVAEDAYLQSLEVPKGVYERMGKGALRDAAREGIEGGAANPLLGSEGMRIKAAGIRKNIGQAKGAMLDQADSRVRFSLDDINQGIENDLSSQPRHTSDQIKAYENLMEELKTIRSQNGNNVSPSTVDEIKQALQTKGKYNAKTLTPGTENMQAGASVYRETLEDAIPGIDVVNKRYQDTRNLQNLTKDFDNRLSAKSMVGDLSRPQSNKIVSSTVSRGNRVLSLSSDQASKILSRNAQALGQWTGPISAGAARGNLEAVMFKLNKDPEFRDHLRQLEESGELGD